LEVGYSFLDLNGRREWWNVRTECWKGIIARLPILQAVLSFA